MWVARFRLRDDEDIYSPLCLKHGIEIFAVPYTHFEKGHKINLHVGLILSGDKDKKLGFLRELKKDCRIKSVERHEDFLFVHAQHSLSRETRAEIKIFYNPQYVLVRPIRLAKDGWEYWEVACLDRKELNKLVNAACKHYHGELFSVREERVRSVTSLELMPRLTAKQLESLKLAFNEGYYGYPRNLTLPELAKKLGKSYATFQEHLRKAEAKLVEYFIKYR